jgi:hypothetical protein
MDSSNQQYEEDLSESQWGKLYGPPPISNPYRNKRRQYLSDPYITLYGPRPIGYVAAQKPWKKYFRSVIIFVIGVLVGGIIAWLLSDCSKNSKSTLYGPPPIDSTQTIVPSGNE